MADYKVTDTELTSIANAIRTKGGTQAQLEFPTEFVSAIQAIPTGGGKEWTSLKNYIQSTQSGSLQYINTGYIPNENTSFELIADISSGGGSWATPFGSRNSSGEAYTTKPVSIMTKFNGAYQFNTQFASSAYLIGIDNSHYSGEKTCIKLKKRNGSWENETDYFAAKENVYVSGYITEFPIYLFTLNEGNTDSVLSACACIMKLYRFRIFESDILVHEFIPWQDNGVACLKDTVTGDIKYNAGTGDFVYGTDS